MIAMIYPQSSTGELAASLATAAAAQPRPGATSWVFAAGGGWGRGTWRDSVRRTQANGTPAAAVSLRSASGDRVLGDGEWIDIARQMASLEGLRGQPWVAVRTGARSVVVLAQTRQAPHPTALRAFTNEIRRTHGRPAPARPAVPAATGQATTAGQAFPRLNTVRPDTAVTPTGPAAAGPGPVAGQQRSRAR